MTALGGGLPGQIGTDAPWNGPDNRRRAKYCPYASATWIDRANRQRALLR
jgi:hypothetical protein